jgi:hypothetical protein
MNRNKIALVRAQRGAKKRGGGVKVEQNLPKARSEVAAVSVRGNEPASSLPSDNPEACFSASTEAHRSFNDVCLTFSAIAPIAWAAATLVSQFLLRVY